MNKNDAKEKLKNVDFIRLVFTDLDGRLKNIELSNSQIDKVLNGEVMFDGSSVKGFSRIEESDMFLVPDLSSLKVIPRSLENSKIVAMMFCNTHKLDKEPYEGDPRNVLIRTIEKVKKLGYEVNVGPEPEFFLLDSNGKPIDNGGYFDLLPMDKGTEVRRDIVLALEKLGFEMEISHHEVARGQNEVGFKYDEALKTADNIQIFKYVVQNIARQHNFSATFMPKPFQGINGSGMHCNISLFKDGKNSFLGKDNELSETAKQFIGGILKYSKEIAAVTNPTVNSYKRLVSGYEAPVYRAWSGSNRSCMIRIPATRGNGTRVEVRNPDPSANPYLNLAVLIEAGIKGIQEKIAPPAETKQNLFSREINKLEEVDALPCDLKTAVFEMKKGNLVKEAFGDELFAKYVTSKENEWDEYRLSVSNWEIKRYR